MAGSGPPNLLYNLQAGSVQNRPMLLRSWPLDANPIDPDQSNAPETFWRSGSISAGAGSTVLGLCLPELLSLIVLAVCTFFPCYLNLCALHFSCK